MSAYRYPFGPDGRRLPPVQQFYERQRPEPTTRPLPSARQLDPGAKPAFTDNMKSGRPSELKDHDVREDERDDTRTHRDIMESNNVSNRLRAGSLPSSEVRHAPTGRLTGSLEEHTSMQLLSRRTNELQYQSWLQTKSVYPGGARSRPPQMRASYPMNGPSSVHTSRILEHAQRTHQRARDIEALEHEMRSRIAASVLTEASVPFSQAPSDYRRDFSSHLPSYERDEPVRKEEQPFRVGSSSDEAREEVDTNPKPAQDPPLQSESDELRGSSSLEREKRAMESSQGTVTYDTSNEYDEAPRKRLKHLPPHSVSGNPETGMLDLLCSATLEVGPLKDNSQTGCSCSKSQCVKLYCECFKARRHCNDVCACANCKNTVAESGADGVLTRAIRATLGRNPHAFTKTKKEPVEPVPGELVCRCVKSRCLKLYCDCFQGGQVCGVSCSCISCLNTTEESAVGGRRSMAIRQCLEKRPDAFEKKVKEIGSGCACKNNRCLKKYCDCFRFSLACTDKCSCKDCENLGTRSLHQEMTIQNV